MTTVTNELTEAANAARLVQKHRDELRYVPQVRRWYAWDGVLWVEQPDDAHAIRCAIKLADEIPGIGKEVERFRTQSLSLRGARAAVGLASASLEMRVAADLLDRDAHALNTISGIVDLRTGQLHPHDPQAWHSKVTGCGYDPDQDCPMWTAFLARTFGNDDPDLIGYVQELFGLAAIGTVLEHVLPFCFGFGKNGKTVLLETVQKVFGDYADVAPANFLQAGRDKHETEIARLNGTRFIICSEVDPHARFDEQKVKQLTGGDRLTGRFMRADFVSFTPTHTLFMMANHRPEVTAGGADPDDMRVRRARAQGETLAERANSAIEDVNRHARSYFEKVRKANNPDNPRFTPQGLKDELNAYSKEAAALRDARALVEQHDQHVEQLEAELQAEKVNLTKPRDEASERRIDRTITFASQRYSNLEPGKLAAAIQQDIANAGSDEERSALLQLAPSILENRGVPSTFIDEAVARAVPEVGEKVAQLREARKDAAVLRSNLGMVERALDDRRAADPATLVDVRKAQYSDRYRQG